MPKINDSFPEETASAQKAVSFKLPKESLIRATAEYAQCYDMGRRLHTRHFLLFIVKPAADDSGVRLGITVSRKTGHAHIRNRIKRLVRECFRLEIRHLPVSARIIVVAKRHAGHANLTLKEVSTELTDALRGFFRLSQGADNVPD